MRQPIEDWKIAQQELATIDGEVYTWGEARPLLHKRRTARRVGELADIADAMHGEARTLDDYLARAKEVAGRIQAGTVWINQHGMIHPMVPFGGAKGSGWGLEFGIDGLKAVTQPQVISLKK